MRSTSVMRHGTCIVIGNTGVLLEGRPGSGKSSLALRLVDEPGYGLGTDLLRTRLVADDEVVISCKHGALWVSAPESLAGKIEVRGVGILQTEVLQEIELSLVVALTPVVEIERLPLPETVEILGQILPLYRMDASLAVTPSRLRALVSSFVKPL